MKTIGIIGGLSPESTVKYYQWLNEGAREALGGNNAAKIVLISLNQAETMNYRLKKDVAGEGTIFADAARKLKAAGADCILIGSNTSHVNVPYIEEANVGIPLIHLADATADTILASGFNRVALMGTLKTMEEDFYKSRLIAKGIEIIIPSEQDRIYVSDTIYKELCMGVVSESARTRFQQIADGLADQGAQGVILGCTELTLLNLAENKAPFFDTTRIHVHKALEFALA